MDQEKQKQIDSELHPLDKRIVNTGNAVDASAEFLQRVSKTLQQHADDAEAVGYIADRLDTHAYAYGVAFVAGTAIADIPPTGGEPSVTPGASARQNDLSASVSQVKGQKAVDSINRSIAQDVPGHEANVVPLNTTDARVNQEAAVQKAPTGTGQPQDPSAPIEQGPNKSSGAAEAFGQEKINRGEGLPGEGDKVAQQKGATNKPEPTSSKK